MGAWIIVLVVVGFVALYVLFSCWLVLFIFSHLDRFLDGYGPQAFDYSPRRPSWVPPDAFVVDMHAHTRASDGLLTPAQLVKWHIANGYNGVAVTDHNTCQALAAAERAAQELAPGFVIIPGVEFTALNVHMNIFGIREFPGKKNYFWLTRRKIKKTVRWAHQNGWLVQYNHPRWYRPSISLSFTELVGLGFDGVETRNGLPPMELNQAMEAAVTQWNEAHPGRPVFHGGGMDFHMPHRQNRVYTGVLTDDHTTAGILAAIQQNKIRLYSPPDPEADLARDAPEAAYFWPNPERKRLFILLLPFIFPGLWVYKKVSRLLTNTMYHG